ncbi:DUF3231 family protein [Bacillus alkalicellulosilyticus]|uniref:DUF3231 family protein n=1 Tax=Alkalihalobacterium alkalicellulosilyticum TaxID=1912214 RepID=UPI00099824E3
MVEDLEVKSLIQSALNYFEEHLIELRNIFNNEYYPVPNGFTKSDVNLEDPRLFSNIYSLLY